MQAKQILQNLQDEGKLIVINESDEVRMQIFDVDLKGEDYAIVQLAGYSSELDLHIATNYAVNMSDARRFGNYFISLADQSESRKQAISTQEDESINTTENQ